MEKKLTVEEGNKIIADFDGWVKWEQDNKLYWHPERNITHFKSAPDFTYHSNWSDLMPVVAKIQKWYDEESDNYKTDEVENATKVLDLHIHSEIQIVWHWAIQFIQWLNKKQVTDDGNQKE